MSEQGEGTAPKQGEGDELREEDVTRGDALDDRVAEGEDLADDDE